MLPSKQHTLTTSYHHEQQPLYCTYQRGAKHTGANKEESSDDSMMRPAVVLGSFRCRVHDYRFRSFLARCYYIL